MRVNVIPVQFLSDQHLVAEYREVKMGPKALSRSLGSLKGVDKKKISPVYTLNTGHTYFFYDKNGFLEKRLALIVEEMQFRGFQTNFIDLLDDKYDYHPRTFDKEWWGDWEPDVEAVRINLERIEKRFYEKSIDMDTRGWYKLFGHSVADMSAIFNSRKNGYIYTCNYCNSIIDLVDNETHCWFCCKGLDKEKLKKIILNRRDKKMLENEENLEENTEPTIIIKPREFESELKKWSQLSAYIDWLKSNEWDPTEEIREVGKFVMTELNFKILKKLELEKEGTESTFEYDEFDLESLAEIFKIITLKILNKKEILTTLISIIILEQDKIFFNEYFKKELE